MRHLDESAPHGAHHIEYDIVYTALVGALEVDSKQHVSDSK
jgi:hypothetical protein